MPPLIFLVESHNNVTSLKTDFIWTTGRKIIKCFKIRSKQNRPHRNPSSSMRVLNPKPSGFVLFHNINDFTPINLQVIS